MKKIIAAISIASMLSLSGCLETYRHDAVIKTNIGGVNTCYILHGYTIMHDHNKITWRKPFNPIIGDDSTVFSSSEDNMYVYSAPEKTFTHEQFVQAAKTIGIDDISKCVDMK